MSGTLKSALLGSKLRILFSLGVALGVAVAAGVSLGVLGAPSVVGMQNQFGTVTDETTEIRTDVVVRNPNPIGLRLGDVSVAYDVTMNGVEMANGTKDGVSVGTGNSTIAFETQMANDRIPPWWVSHVRNGERTTVRVDASVRSGTLGRSLDAPPVERQVETDLISQFNSSETRPVNASQPLISDPVAYVNETSAEWGAVTSAKTPIDTTFVVYNAKTLPMAITEIGYTITMNDVTVGNGTSQRGHVIEGHTTETIRTATVIRNQRLDEWWVSHLENGQVTHLRIDFYAKAEIGGETVRIPLDGMTYTRTIETDVFGTKNQSGDGTATTAESETTTADETATTAGTTTTETTTAGTTTTGTTTTGTTTDDGNGGTTTTDDGLLGLGTAGIR